ncbi:MAG TPA: TlpA disulfide reductase family protein [Solirubrobacterales bacterium]|nr:TlpA disulfide reductase family protein [Solirubrobacterales bacterium]
MAARVLLAAVFALAALGKLGRRAQTEETVAAFRLPGAMRRPVAVGLPIVELAVALALLPAASSPYAAVAALLLLAAFSLAIVLTLRREEAVDCNCFGSLGAAPVSRRTLARNLALMVPAALVAGAGWGDPGPSAVAWVGGMSATAALAVLGGLALATAALALALAWQVMRQNGRLLARLDALEAGAGGAALAAAAPRHTGRRVPQFTLPDVDGRPVSLVELLAAAGELILVFGDPGCHACNPILPEVGRLQHEPGDGPLPVVMSLGDAEDNRVKASEHGLGLVLLQEDFELARALGVSGMPGAVVVDGSGRVAAEPVQGTDRVAELLAASARPARAPTPRPPLQVTMVEGRR